MASLANVVLVLMLLQYYPRQRIPQAVNPQGANTEAVATFAGTFKSADKKFLTIEVEEGQIIRMAITGTTKFFRDGKPAKASDFRADENVTVDASRDAHLNLLAVRVEAVKPAAPAAHKSEDNSVSHSEER
jgi:hypothetical protein